MVGTIEPRKGHAQALAAFELLWAKGMDVNLVIIGKQGWMVGKLIGRLQTHPLLNKKLFWFDGISDHLLQQLYQQANGSLLASIGEGFGLPLIEAARVDLPILARDIPIFREIAGKFATYFSGTTAEELAQALEPWIVLVRKKKAVRSGAIPWLTWAESTKQLLNVILPEGDKV